MSDRTDGCGTGDRFVGALSSRDEMATQTAPAHSVYSYARQCTVLVLSECKSDCVAQTVLRALSSQRQCSITCYGYQERTGRFVSVM